MWKALVLLIFIAGCGYTSGQYHSSSESYAEDQRSEVEQQPETEVGESGHHDDGSDLSPASSVIVEQQDDSLNHPGPVQILEDQASEIVQVQSDGSSGNEIDVATSGNAQIGVNGVRVVDYHYNLPQIGSHEQFEQAPVFLQTATNNQNPQVQQSEASEQLPLAEELIQHPPIFQPLQYLPQQPEPKPHQIEQSVVPVRQVLVQQPAALSRSSGEVDAENSGELHIVNGNQDAIRALHDTLVSRVLTKQQEAIQQQTVAQVLTTSNSAQQEPQRVFKSVNVNPRPTPVPKQGRGGYSSAAQIQLQPQPDRSSPVNSVVATQDVQIVRNGLGGQVDFQQQPYNNPLLVTPSASPVLTPLQGNTLNAFPGYDIIRLPAPQSKVLVQQSILTPETYTNTPGHPHTVIQTLAGPTTSELISQIGYTAIQDTPRYTVYKVKDTASLEQNPTPVSNSKLQYIKQQEQQFQQQQGQNQNQPQIQPPQSAQPVQKQVQQRNRHNEQLQQQQAIQQAQQTKQYQDYQIQLRNRQNEQLQQQQHQQAQIQKQQQQQAQIQKQQQQQAQIQLRNRQNEQLQQQQQAQLQQQQQKLLQEQRDIQQQQRDLQLRLRHKQQQQLKLQQEQLARTKSPITFPTMQPGQSAYSRAFAQPGANVKQQVVYKSSVDPDYYNAIKAKLMHTFSHLNHLQAQARYPYLDGYATSFGPSPYLNPYARGPFFAQPQLPFRPEFNPYFRPEFFRGRPDAFRPPFGLPPPPAEPLHAHGPKVFPEQPHHNKPPKHALESPLFSTKTVDVDYAPGLDLRFDEAAFAAEQARKLGGPAFIDPGHIQPSIGFKLNDETSKFEPLPPTNEIFQYHHKNFLEFTHKLPPTHPPSPPQPVSKYSLPRPSYTAISEPPPQLQPQFLQPQQKYSSQSTYVNNYSNIPNFGRYNSPITVTSKPLNSGYSAPQSRVEVNAIDPGQKPALPHDLLAQLLRATTGEELELEQY